MYSLVHYACMVQPLALQALLITCGSSAITKWCLLHLKRLLSLPTASFHLSTSSATSFTSVNCFCLRFYKLNWNAIRALGWSNQALSSLFLDCRDRPCRLAKDIFDCIMGLFLSTQVVGMFLKQKIYRLRLLFPGSGLLQLLEIVTVRVVCAIGQVYRLS